MTSYEGPPKFNSFRRYFNQIYSDKMLNKLIITLAEKSLFSILAECVIWLKCWKFSKKSSWRFHCESSDKSIIYWFFQQITQSFWLFSSFINSVTLSFTIFERKLLFLRFLYIFQKGKVFKVLISWFCGGSKRSFIFNLEKSGTVEKVSPF